MQKIGNSLKKSKTQYFSFSVPQDETVSLFIFNLILRSFILTLSTLGLSRNEKFTTIAEGKIKHKIHFYIHTKFMFPSQKKEFLKLTSFILVYA